MIAVVRVRAAPVVERASAWLAARSARERVLLGVLAALGAAALAWYGLVQPLMITRQTAVERIELYEGLQARLRAAPSGAAPTPAAPLLAGPLDEAARQAAAAHALNAEVTGGVDRVAVVVTDARFDGAAPFVRALEGGGAMIEELRLEAAGQPGLVNLTLTAVRP